jgi:ABC-type Fe3+/spermidine/putrescine transport system ATPase subunit
VKLESVGKRFANGYAALEDFSLDLAPGQFTSLIGPSGCGKSTVLNLMAGLSEPTSGQVSWGAGGKPDIGFVFQEPTLMPWATVEQNVALPQTLTGRPAAVAEQLAKVGLSAFAASYPRQLSGGMKMRASIARALASQPSLLLLAVAGPTLQRPVRHPQHHRKRLHVGARGGDGRQARPRVGRHRHRRTLPPPARLPRRSALRRLVRQSARSA